MKYVLVILGVGNQALGLFWMLRAVPSPLADQGPPRWAGSVLIALGLLQIGCGIILGEVERRRSA